MRVVHTTRGEVCVQVGRLQGGVLGELGIDGAFKDDGLLHAIPPNALPADVFHGHAFGGWLGSANTTCEVAGEATVSDHRGLDRSAAPNPSASAHPADELRDVFFGLLGPRAVSVTYRDSEGSHTQAVLPGTGAYLIVKPMRPGEQIETGGSSLGTPGDLAPSPTHHDQLSHRRSRVRTRTQPPARRRRAFVDAMPRAALAARGTGRRPHVPLHARLLRSGGAISAVRVSFTAPRPVTNAGESYAVMMPTSGHCPGESRSGATGYTLETLAHNVKRGSTVTLTLAYPFEYVCSGAGHRHRRLETFSRSNAFVQAVYHPRSGREVIVGTAVLHAPPGARLTQPPPR